MNAHATIVDFRRAALEAYIEELIALLDHIDGEAELEDGGDDEPSFGTDYCLNGKLEYELEDDPAECGIADSDAFNVIMQGMA